MQTGLLINSIIGFGVFIVSLLTSFFLLQKRKRGAENVTIGYSLFWLSVSLLYFFVGLRTLFAYLSNPEMDRKPQNINLWGLDLFNNLDCMDFYEHKRGSKWSSHLLLAIGMGAKECFCKDS